MENFPIQFYEDEYDKHLGLYQKWICGDKNQQIEKLFSMSAFQTYDPNKETDGGFVTSNYQKYAEYLYISATSILANSTEYYVRIYIDESIFHPNNLDREIWICRINKLIILDRIQIICVKFPRYYLNNANCHKELLPVMFRYLAMFDKNTSIILFRDIDNIYTDQHEYFVQEWLQRGDEVCFYMNENYKRQEVIALTPTNLILEDVYYTTILSGLWNIKKPFGSILPMSLWQKIFAYIESYTNSTHKKEYADYKHFEQRFTYGFDELALTRVLVPYLIYCDLKFYAIPIKIYDVEFLNNMFDNPLLTKFLRNVSDTETIQCVKKLIVNNYWDLYSPTAGLAQYMLCILTNIYFGIIQKKSKFYTNERFINDIKNKIIPNVLLMSVGVFTFKNYKRYNWYPLPHKPLCGSKIVSDFLETNNKITIAQWTSFTYITVDISKGPEPYPQDPDCYNI